MSYPGPLTDAQRAKLDRLEAKHQKIKEQTYCIVYGGARLSLEAGDDPDKIRAENMAMAAGEDVRQQFGDAFHEDARANIQAAVEDALSKRPPRYPQWFSKMALEEWGLV